MAEAGVKVYTVENVRAVRVGKGSSSPCIEEKIRMRDAAYAALRADLDPLHPMVGVDCEGTGTDFWSHVPNGNGCAMVQVATRHVVIVECVTAKREPSTSAGAASRCGGGAGAGAGLSDELRSILSDPDIMCAFCDHKGDAQSIAAETDPNETEGEPCQLANVVDVQALAGKQKLGLAQTATFATGVALSKQSFKKKGWWRLRSVEAYVFLSVHTIPVTATPCMLHPAPPHPAHRTLHATCAAFTDSLRGVPPSWAVQ